jgi:hypothetical protein
MAASSFLSFRGAHRANYDVQLHIENLDPQSPDSGFALARAPE